MDKMDVQGLETWLGISPPWAIDSIKPNHGKQVLEIYLKLFSQKPKELLNTLDASVPPQGEDTLIKEVGIKEAGIKEASVKENWVEGVWQYRLLGSYTTLIHAKVPAALAEKSVVGLEVFDQPPFLGHPHRSYSNFLRQQAALARLQGIDEKIFGKYFNIGAETIKALSADLRDCPPKLQALTHLPTELDLIWQRIIKDQVHLRTNLLPLKLLLSKLKLTAAREERDHTLPQMVAELRKFFIANAHLIDDEIDQLCGIVTAKARRQVTAEKTRLRLVLPAIKNPVWIDILVGRLKLNSQNVPLNLLISRQRQAFLKSKDNRSKIQVIETIREYFRKSYRSLKPELVLINRAINVKAKLGINIPNSDHKIWQSILKDNDFIPSNNVAYKLLLAKLRAEVEINKDPVIRLNAAKSIRDFIRQNQKVMQKEVSILMQQCSA